MHAKAEVTVDFAVPCANVATEIMARVSGEGGWTDPHNGGSYSCIGSCPTSGTSPFTLQRVTGRTDRGGPYTDKMDFHFTSVASGHTSGCQMTACSESQSNSYLDFSTNYCNLRNLYCGPSDKYARPPTLSGRRAPGHVCVFRRARVLWLT
jgi:hypothetical protein